MLAQEFACAQKEVIEIESVGFSQHGVIHTENCGDVFPIFIARLLSFRFHDVRSDAVIFGVTDLSADASGGIILGREIQLLDGALDRGFLVVVIVNCKVAGKAEILRFAAQEARAERMKCGDPNIRSVPAA